MFTFLVPFRMVIANILNAVLNITPYFVYELIMHAQVPQVRH